MLGSLILKQTVDDADLQEFVYRARAGDAEAGRELHLHLAIGLVHGKLTPYAIKILATMHSDAASGINVADAMMIATPSNRPSQMTRDVWIFDFIEAKAELYRFCKEKNGKVRRTSSGPYGSMSIIFKGAAKTYGISPSRAKAIYYKVRVEHAKESGKD